jgi:prolyl-tRNA synthetase
MATSPLPSQSEDFPGWYGEVVRRAGLAENSLARGAMVIKPYGFAIWEAIQRGLDDRIKATGHENLYFPLLMPQRLLEREADHVEGFAPEVYAVTHAGGKPLEEPLVVRPTSEAIIWATYARWIQSYRDLPLLYNQWANVMRAELRPRLFLRTTEFLWQEGHTAHETGREAREEALRILHEVYADVAERVMAMPVLRGRKSASERFPGAVETYTIEALMRDGKALQAGTSHDLGQNFARAFGVTFLDREGKEQHAYASSWGSSTRLVGGLIMTHGDAAGLRLPPAVAPVQVVIVPIHRGDDGRTRVVEAAERERARLVAAGVRARVDDRDERPGFKFHDWELRGVPVRVEIGPRDLDEGRAVIARRDVAGKSEVPLERLPDEAVALLAQVQAQLLDEALAFRASHTLETDDYAELREFLAGAGGFGVAGWCGDAACEQEVKEQTKATIRCLPIEPEPVSRACVVCGGAATERATWAQSY